MSKWTMTVDVEKCENCYNCFIAVKDEHVGNDFPGYAAAQPEHGQEWVKLNTFERGSMPMVEANFMPTMCNHCDNPPCMKAAKDGAVTKRADGIVLIDPVKSKGQRQIVDACPYGALAWNEEKQIPQGWIFDAHLLDAGWTKTRIEQACPTGALRSRKVNDSEMAKIAKAEGLRVLKPQLGTKPRVWYKNLHLTDTHFIGGTVLDSTRGDVIEGAHILLEQDGHPARSTHSDCFGDFTIDGLSDEGGACRLILSSGDRTTSRTLQLNDSQYLGLITL